MVVSASVCAVHPDVRAREHCGSCGRPACLACAIPIRGEIRCRECALDELGEPAQHSTHELPPRRTLDLPAGVLFAAGVLASLLPWDRQGVREGFLSAWVPRPDPWPLLASVLLLLAAAAALRSWGGRVRGAHIVLGVLAVVATTLALPGPALSVRGPVPLVVLALGLAATVTGAARIWITSRP